MYTHSYYRVKHIRYSIHSTIIVNWTFQSWDSGSTSHSLLSHLTDLRQIQHRFMLEGKNPRVECTMTCEGPSIPYGMLPVKSTMTNSHRIINNIVSCTNTAVDTIPCCPSDFKS